MVEIILIIEGGRVASHPKVDPKTLQNTSNLEQGFYKLLRKEISDLDLDDYVNIIMGGDWITARTIFRDRKKKELDALLLIDSDVPDNEKEANRIERKLEPQEAIFFMVQEMEAWFFSQPEILDEYYGETEESIAVKITKNPKEYTKPSNELNEILKAHYPEKKRRKLYKKMRDDAELMQLLDLSKLKQDFDDVHRLITTLQTKITNA